ncbi:hypothetical protein BN2476_140065 [Paraburkholderia piptadeniae]|uniref:Uncharacterized protein n=1 Tax=Paraburkholderia piptadeniae TaxID=1701573 RepID=A0A1N7RT88_9BURK|nr:hypothetical protein BN2476_140065 [Paraburkholderia piptadeniae]
MSANVSIDERSLVVDFYCVNRVFEYLNQGLTLNSQVPSQDIHDKPTLGIIQMSC